MRQDSTLSVIHSYRTHVMGAAALWIWIFHEWIPVFSGVPVLSLGEVFLQDIGFLSVDLFFFLSGLVLHHSLEKHTIPAFYRRRLARVYPPYLLTAIAMLVFLNRDVGTFFSNALGLYFFTSNIFSFLWFVPAILILYLAFPLYFRLFRGASRKGLFFLGSLGLWLVCTLALKGHIRPDLYGFTNRIPVFLLGIFTGWVIGHRNPRFSARFGFGCLFLLGLSVCLAYLTTYKGMALLVPEPHWFLPGCLFSFSAAFLLAKLFFFLQCSAPGRGLLAFLKFYGGISLEFYCVQALTAELLPLTAGLGNPLLTNLLRLACATGGAWILQRLCRIPKPRSA